MANRERGEVRLIAGDQTFTLRLTVESACEVEDRAGKDFDALITAVNRGSVQALRWLLWASLQAKHGDRIARPEDVGPVMDAAGSVAGVLHRMKSFLDLNAEGRPTVKASGTGKPSRHPWQDFYATVRCLGLSSDQFWALSLKELWLELGVGRRQQERDVTLAWWIGSFCGVKKMPNLKQLLSSRRDGSDRQTPRQQLAVMEQLSARLGVRLERIPYTKKVQA